MKKPEIFSPDDLPDARMARLHKLAQWMDARWRIPGMQRRIGLDGLLGLIPGIGDAFGAAIASYIVYEAHQLGVPWHLKLRMIWNLLVDLCIGSIPIVGDVFDIAWKANLRNTRLLQRHLAKGRQGVHKK